MLYLYKKLVKYDFDNIIYLVLNKTTYTYLYSF